MREKRALWKLFSTCIVESACSYLCVSMHIHYVSLWMENSWLVVLKLVRCKKKKITFFQSVWIKHYSCDRKCVVKHKVQEIKSIQIKELQLKELWITIESKEKCFIEYWVCLLCDIRLFIISCNILIP